MKNGILILLSILISHILSAQLNSSPENSPLVSSIALGTLSVDKYRSSQLNYDDIKGTPFVEKEPLSGYLRLVSGEKTHQVPLQYDIYSSEFFYIDEDGQQLVIDTKAVREIVMEGKDEDYLFKRANPKWADTFYDILYEDDDMMIFNEMEINLREGTDNGIVKTDPNFNSDDNYYHVKKGESPKKIKLKKKDIFKFFNKSDQNKMEAFAKENKLKLKKRKEYKKMFSCLKS